jgi:isopenicillin N synthase-like dioxygenase
MDAQFPSGPSNGIPVIDLSPFAHANSRAAQRAACAAELNTACEAIGFFYVSLPGLAEAGASLMECCREFHTLPVHVKQEVSASLSPFRRGFATTWAGDGGSCASGIGCAPPDPKEMFVLGSEGTSSPMHGPNLWPSAANLPDFESKVRGAWASMLQAAKVLSIALAAALGEPDGTFDEAMRDPASVLLFLKYDPGKLSPGSAVGCGAHTDCGFLSFLVQDPQSNAPLHVQRGALHAGAVNVAGAAGVDEDAWVEAPGRQGAVLVNLGDLVAQWTNGRYRSTVHRVMLEREAPARFAVAMFANPTFTTPVACLPSCCAPTLGRPPAHYAPTTAGVYMSKRLGLMFERADEESSR